jgi:Lar family restriction alleviation protein
MVALKPCPFCGGPPGWQDPSGDKSVNFRYLACINPDCKLDVRTRRAGTDEELIADWNRRVQLEEMPASSRIRTHLRKILAQVTKGDRES